MLHGLGFYGLFVSSSNGVEGFIIRGPEGQNVIHTWRYQAQRVLGTVMGDTSL